MTLEESLRYMENVRKRLEIANGEHIRRTFTMPALSNGLLDSVRYFSDVLADVTQLEHPAGFAQYEVDALRNISSIMSNFYEILNSGSLDGIFSVIDDFQEVLEDYSENLIAWNDSEDVAASEKTDGSYNDFAESRTANADGSIKPFFPKLEANSTLVSNAVSVIIFFLSIFFAASGININININVNSNNVTNVTNESDIENNDEFQKQLEAQFQKIAEELKQCSQKMNKN